MVLSPERNNLPSGRVPKKSRTRLVNFWPTRRVPPLRPLLPLLFPLCQPVVAVCIPARAKKKHTTSRKSGTGESSRGKQLHNFQENLSDLAWGDTRVGVSDARDGRRADGRAFQRPTRAHYFPLPGSPPSRCSFRFYATGRNFFKLLLELNYGA